MKNMATTKYITCRASQITLCSFNVTAKEGMSLHIPLNVIGAYVLILYLSGSRYYRLCIWPWVQAWSFLGLQVMPCQLCG